MSIAIPYRFAFVSNSLAIATAVQNYANSRNIHIEIQLASMEKALPVARRLLEEGVEIILGGGGTGRLMRRQLQRPVVTIANDHLSVLKSLMRAKKISSKIAVTCYDHIPEWVSVFANLLNITITPILFTTTREHVQGIAQAIQQGAGVIVGGGICSEVAQAHGCPAVIVMPSLGTLERAIDEAINIASSMRRDNERLAWINGMMDAMQNGIIGITQDSKILLKNNAIQQFLPQLRGNSLSASLRKKLHLDDVLEQRVHMEGVLRGSHKREPETLFTSHPVIVNGEVCGAFSMLAPATAVDSLQSRLSQSRSKAFSAKYTFSSIIGKSKIIEETKQLAKKYALSRGALYIHGESGTGKELFAQAIHNESPVRDGPFVALNCSALSEALLQSELFGYEEGAFTDARRGGKPGLLEIASGGTLFLDEIGDISPAVQVNLLRVLETGEIYRIGGERPYSVRLRVVSSSWKDLVNEVREGRFRADLFYRLTLLRLDIPSLRQRIEDIPLITEKLLQRSGHKITFSKELFDILENYSWPGNIRELDAVIQRYILISDKNNDTILMNKIINDIKFANITNCQNKNNKIISINNMSLHDCLQNTEKEIIINYLISSINKKDAAKKLGISTNTLWRKIKEHNISI